MWFRVTNSKQEERLVGIRQDHLLHVARVPGQARKRALARQNRVDSPFALANVADHHPVADGNQISAAARPFETTADSGEKLPAIGQLHIEEEPVRSDDDSLLCISRHTLQV